MTYSHGLRYGLRRRPRLLRADVIERFKAGASIYVQLFTILDRLLPAKCSFAWATSTGFLLDVDHLDYAGLGP